MKKKLLVVSAHAADWCTRSGGTIYKYVKSGYEVVVIALTYGEHGESRSFWVNHPEGPESLCKEERNREARNAAAVLGIERIEFCDYRDYPLEMGADRVQYLIDKVLEIRPELVLTHWIEDPFNVDHHVTAKTVVRAVSAAARLGAHPNTPAHYFPDLFFFESTLPHSEFNRFEIDTYVDITDVFDKKMEAIRCFHSQPELMELYTDCGAARGKQANDWARERGCRVVQAEAFKRYIPYVGRMLPLSDMD